MVSCGCRSPAADRAATLEKERGAFRKAKYTKVIADVETDGSEGSDKF